MTTATANTPNLETDITGLTCDSREVSSGFLFAAIPGASNDGRDFIDDALGRGAAAILGPVGTPARARVPVLTSTNPRRSYACLAANFHAVQPPHIAAVTGTNGKTSVVSFARQIWSHLGDKAASLGTLGITAPGFEAAEGLTTPDAVALHRSLADLSARGVEKLAMEASSHGLQQYRLDGVRIASAAFTNLSRDHLDYHATMDDYLEAKLRLFRDLLPEDGVAVLNADDPNFPKACEAVPGRIIGYGVKGADIRLESLQVVAGGQRLTLSVMGEPYTLTLPLSGAFQVENALCALGMVLAAGDDPGTAVEALESLQGAPGRLQHVATCTNGAAVYVDFAHTPDALATVLRAMRPHAAGKLNLVFGCGGDRDPGKRPQMGRIACELADDVIVTDDNPRGEEAGEIRAQVLQACPRAQDMGDRARAIEAAIGGLRGEDILIVAGKGHETGQIVKGAVRPFNDAEEIRRAVREAAL